MCPRSSISVPSRSRKIALRMTHYGRRELYNAAMLLLLMLLQAKLELGAHTDTPPKSFPGEATVELTVRNAGDAAREPTVVLTFTDKSSAPVRKMRVLLTDA